MVLIAAMLGLTLMMLGSSTNVAAESEPTPTVYPYLTVVITEGDDTVSWSDPDNCSSDYNIYLAESPRNNNPEKPPTHLGSVASGSTAATLAISGSARSYHVQLYCGAYVPDSTENELIAYTRISAAGRIHHGTYSSAALTALSIGSETLSPTFQRGIFKNAVEVESDVDTITLNPTSLAGYSTDFLLNPGTGVISTCDWFGNECNYTYASDGVLSDADSETEGFQVNLSRGKNQLGIGVNKGSIGIFSTTYKLTVTVRNAPATGQPTITGTAQVGHTLTASTSDISDADGLTNVSYRYQWLSGRDAEIEGATSSTYEAQASDHGKVIKVRVDFTDDAGNAESLTSEGTAAVVLANTPATGVPTITGTAQVGETLTADTSGTSDADGLDNVSYSYQWLSGRDAEIEGATSAAYEVQSSDNGKVIKVRVDFTDDAGNAESLTSAGTSAVVTGGL